jgi:hypothetical protein
MSEDWIEVRPGYIVRRSVIMSALEQTDGGWLLECPEPVGSLSSIKKDVVRMLIQNRYEESTFEREELDALIQQRRGVVPNA